MELLDKVRLIIGNKCESPSQFADEIGVPRSAISHLLNGRNRPSLDIIRKIIRRYPDLGTDWILEDETMPRLGGGIIHSKTESKTGSTPIQPVYGRPLDLFESLQTVPESVQKNLSANKSGNGGRKVVRVLVFFSDGTFEEFGRAEP